MGQFEKCWPLTFGGPLRLYDVPLYELADGPYSVHAQPHSSTGEYMLVRL